MRGQENAPALDPAIHHPVPEVRRSVDYAGHLSREFPDQSSSSFFALVPFVTEWGV